MTGVMLDDTIGKRKEILSLGRSVSVVGFSDLMKTKLELQHPKFPHL